MSVRAHQAVIDAKGDVVRYWPPPFPQRYKPMPLAAPLGGTLPFSPCNAPLSDNEAIVIAQRVRRYVRGGLTAADALRWGFPKGASTETAERAILSVITDEQRNGKLAGITQSEAETSAAVERVSRTDVADDWRFTPLDSD